MEYHISKGGKQSGPFSLEQVNSFLQKGTYCKEDLVWRIGMDSWLPISSLQEFSSIGEPPPIPTNLPNLPPLPLQQTPPLENDSSEQKSNLANSSQFSEIKQSGKETGKSKKKMSLKVYAILVIIGLLGIVGRQIIVHNNVSNKPAKIEVVKTLPEPEKMATNENESESITSNSSNVVRHGFDADSAFKIANGLINSKNYDSAIVVFQAIDSSLKQISSNDTSRSLQMVAISQLSWLSFIVKNYEQSLSFAKSLDEILSGNHLIFSESIIKEHKNQSSFTKIWSNVALGKLDEAIQLSENKGKLGANLEKHPDGFKITQVFENSPAEHDHLKIGDILTSFNNISLNNTTKDSLGHLISASSRGSRVYVSIIRDSNKMVGYITIGIIDSPYPTSITE
jgi:hypothetical protein